MKPTVAFHTLGCKLNFSETSTLAKSLQEKGFSEVDFSAGADVYVINTCSVTESADKECKLIVHRALNKNPEAFIAVTGCFAQLKPEQAAGIKGVDLVLGASEKFNLPQYLDNITKRTQAKIMACEVDELLSFHSAVSHHERTRVFLKVQDGCDYNCSFCTIPLARGRSRSDTISNVVNNVCHAVDGGAKEIVLSGVNLGDFGSDSGRIAVPGEKHRESFYDLVKALDRLDLHVRFRISSIEPNLLSDEIIELVAASKKFVPHFHIPLQSGSNKILKLMRRRYLRELYAGRVHTVKSLMPHACIGADVITGFPGETENDFEETVRFIEGIDVSYLHVFTYSERENTVAAEMESTVPLPERKERNKILRSLSQKKLRNFYNEQKGKTLNVLFESENKNGYIYGYTENYVRVKREFSDDLVNSLLPGELAGMNEKGEMEIVLPHHQMS